MHVCILSSIICMMLISSLADAGGIVKISDRRLSGDASRNAVPVVSLSGRGMKRAGRFFVIDYGGIWMH